MVSGMIFDIKHFAVHDGPGIRTTVFLKGCPLRCLWCHNPESMSPHPQILFTPRRCIACGHCFEACPEKAHELVNDVHVIHRERCTACGACVEGCYAGAIEMAGRVVTVEEVMEEVLKDRAFYENSRGGVTLSGGEPLAQPEFSLELLRSAKNHGLHTIIDTSGHAPWEQIERILPYTDLILYDLKHMDSKRHKALTGVPNELILDNLRRITETGHPIWIRIPLIPDQNDDDENIHALGNYLSTIKNVERVDILRYHRLAESKYGQTGLEYRLRGMEPPTKEEAEAKRRILLKYGLSNVTVK
ncbi:MAG: glycyl-radical enzyme activating protein [Candidatus Bathyarchaeota archaeon]|nr:glycyl-radical enzyme activating protein [Candidatus Bathyarchaeota archaeon]